MPELTSIVSDHKGSMSAVQATAIAALEQAFSTFQRQSSELEDSHQKLRTQLRKAQRSLQQTNRELEDKNRELESIRQHLQSTLEAISDPIFSVPQSGEPTPANPAAEAFCRDLGLNATTLFGMSEFVGITTNPTQNLQIELALPNTQRKILLISSVPTLNRAATVVSIKDITEQRRLDRLASLGRVAASVAHEIRNPLGAIEGFSVLLRRDLAENSAPRSIADKITLASRQLNAVVGNLLSFTRLPHPRPIVTDPDAIASEVLDHIRHIAGDRGIKLEFHPVGEVRDAYPKLDPVLLRQVLTNLIVNALDAVKPETGLVRLIVKRTTETTIFIVADNGPGVPQHLKRSIFDPFFSTKDGGLGLGLSLSFQIVEAHQGTICESGSPGNGAIFTVTIPNLP